MARALLREHQMGDRDNLSEDEHDVLVHENLVTSGTLNFQDGTEFVKAGEAATDKQIWYMEQLLEGMDGQSSAK